MSNLIFSLNSTLPIFIVIIIGYVLGQKKFLTKEFCSVADKLVFRVGLPAMLFCDMTSIDLTENFNGKFVLFCFGATAISIIVIWILARIFLRDKSLTGEFVQACYRSSAAILGVAFIQNIYGTSGMAPLMMLGSVPLFNIFAVLILTALAISSVIVPNVSADVNTFFQFFSFFLYFLFCGKTRAKRQLLHGAALICRSGYRFREVDTASKSTSSAASGVFFRTLAPPSVIRVMDRRFSTIWSSQLASS